MKFQNYAGQFLDGTNTQFWLSSRMSCFAVDSKIVLSHPLSLDHHLPLGACRFENTNSIRCLGFPYDIRGGGRGKNLLLGVEKQGEIEGLIEAGIRLHERIKGMEKDHDSSLHIEAAWSVSLMAVNAKGAPFGFPLRENGIHMANAEEPLCRSSPFPSEKMIPEIGLGESLNLETQFMEFRDNDAAYLVDPFFQVSPRIDIDDLFQKVQHFRFLFIEALDNSPGVYHGLLPSAFGIFPLQAVDRPEMD